MTPKLCGRWPAAQTSLLDVCDEPVFPVFNSERELKVAEPKLKA
jgi:hypothetical protein